METYNYTRILYHDGMMCELKVDYTSALACAKAFDTDKELDEKIMRDTAESIKPLLSFRSNKP